MTYPDDLLGAKIFDRERSHAIYLWAAKTQKAVDAFLRSEEGVSQEERTNLKFHLTTILVTEALGRRVDSDKPNDVAELLGHEFKAEEMRAALEKLRASMKTYRENSGLAMDRTAKTNDFVQAMLDEHYPVRLREPAATSS